ncbi:MAG: hypothetical protein IJ019_05255 [Alphaproteobacteria bacterium]|nr:hypothetical protein [Alphaproteobacteria bacterium]
MKRKKFGFTEVENNSDFVSRVLVLSFPSAMVFILLAFFDLLTPYWAVVSYDMIVLFNVAFLLPISFELAQVKKYIVTLSKGERTQDFELKLSEQEAREIADAVNSMHKFWVYKTDALEAQSMSDTAVLDTLPDPILMIDRSGNILGANLSTRKLLGENITDKNIENVFNANNFIKAVSKVLKKESESENLIFYAQSPFNKKIYAHIKQLPWFSKGRAVAVVSLYDMTKAMKIEKMQSDFVANASHELRTPLSVISGFIETLQTSAKDDKEAQETFLKIMADQAEYMSALIENLLSLSRIELSQDETPKEKVRINTIIEEVSEALSLKASERNMKIMIDMPDKIPFIMADAQQVRQLVQNLTDNALKYGVAASDVTINVKIAETIPSSKSYTVAEGKAVAVSVNNKGPKINPEDLARLTERFYRLQEHKNLNIKGTGLGLSIAKQIILRHRGNLTVTSTNYDGTTFTIYLPLK